VKISRIKNKKKQVSPIEEKQLYHIEYEDLFNYYGDDFQVYKSVVNNLERFYLSIEYYMGYKSLEEGIQLYDKFRNELYNYISNNNYESYPKTPVGAFYRTRELAVNYHHGCYWIDAGLSNQLSIWELYYYIEDVIKQLQTLQKDIELGVIKVEEGVEV
jgi:hypothetical protein